MSSTTSSRDSMRVISKEMTTVFFRERRKIVRKKEIKFGRRRQNEAEDAFAS